MPETTDATKKIQAMRLMCAIKTPYLADGSIDLVAYDKHAEHLISNGVEALIIGGTTGEGHLFSWEEHLVLIAHTKAIFGDRVCVVGNTGSNHTGESIEATKKGFAVGMDCALLINPYYGKTSARGMLMHINAAMGFGPAIIYNVPSRTGQDLTPEILTNTSWTGEALSNHPNFAGVKECCGPERIKILSDMGMFVWSGNDDLCHQERHECGAQGVISVTANVVPGLFSQLMTEKNDELNAKLVNLYSWLFSEPNPIGLNTMLMQLGMAFPMFRLPYTPRDAVARAEAVEIINAIGVEHFPVGEAGVRVLDDADFLFSTQ